LAFEAAWHFRMKLESCQAYIAPFPKMAAPFAKLALLAVFARAAQPRPHQQRQSEGLFLQHTGSRSRSATATPFTPDFFSGDADKMAEMPPYDNETVALGDKNAVQKWDPDPACKSVCNWHCGPKMECNQAEVCKPQCLPPSCKTICKKSAGLCQTRCNKPHCAVVCPGEGCPSSRCPRCGTVCTEPNCTTVCGDDCHSICEKPMCTWNCHPVACPKPTCFLKCDDKCSENNTDPTWLPTAPPGSAVASMGDASLDPNDLVKKVTAPPPWTLQVTTPAYKETPVRIKRPRGPKWPMQDIIKPLLPRSSDGPHKPASPRDDGPPPLPGGHRPVRDLKRRWAIQDAERAHQHRND